MPQNTTFQCLSCDRTENEIPLVPVQYRGAQRWICPDCLPKLIHRRAELADKLDAPAASGEGG